MSVRGFLRIVVLKELSDSPKTGYALMKSIGEKVGSKPSPGSMYPLLDALKKEGLVVIKDDAYSLTASGKKTVGDLEKKREECISHMVEGAKMMSALTGEDTSMCEAFVQELRKGNVPFKEVQSEIHEAKILMAKMIEDKSWKEKAPKVKQACREFVKRLKSI